MHSIITILKNPWYAVIAGGMAFSLFAFIALFPNAMLVGQIIAGNDVSLRDAVSIVGGLIGGIAMSQGIIGATLATLTSVLFGINLALVAYAYRSGALRMAHKGMAASVAGTGVSILGTGCAACGTLAFPALASLVGVSGAPFLFPFLGIGFGLLGMTALLLSIYFLVRRIDRGAVCTVSS